MRTDAVSESIAKACFGYADPQPTNEVSIKTKFTLSLSYKEEEKSRSDLTEENKRAKRRLLVNLDLSLAALADLNLNRIKN